MKIIKDFDFFQKVKKDAFKKMFEMEPYVMRESLKKIETIVKWTKKSVYKNILKNVDLVVMDCPVSNEFAYVDCDPYTKRVYICMNLVSLYHDYKHNHGLNRIVFKKEPVSFCDYVSFFLLHEIGHIVHISLVTSGNRTMYDKFEEHFFKYKSTFKKLEKMFVATEDIEKNYQIQKKYRQLPTEKVADSFAYRYIKILWGDKSE